MNVNTRLRSASYASASRSNSTADVILERLRHADRRARHGELGVGLLLGPLNAPLDLAHVTEVLVEPRLIGLPEVARQISQVGLDQIEHAAVRAHAGEALFARVAAAEHAVEQRRAD